MIRTMPIFLVLVLFILSAPYCRGVDITVTASSDSSIDSRQPDTAFPDDEVLKPDMIGPYNEDGDIVKCYMRFALPSNIGQVTAADLRVFRTGVDNAGIYFYVWAVNDDVEQGTTVDTYTWNNAPGNTPDYLNITWAEYLPYADQNTTTFISGINAYTTGLEYGLYQTQNLIDFLNADTDGVVTLFLCKRQNYVYDVSFASIENTDPATHGPQLTLSYVPTPVVVEPTGGETKVTEGGAADTYTITISTAPAADVTVTLNYDTGQITTDVPSVTFTPQDYAPRTITVSAVDDSVGERDLTTLITHTVTSADPAYDNAPARMVSVKVIDDDTKTVQLAAVADSTIQRSAPASAFPTGDLSPNRLEGVPPIMHHCYVQFDLPGDFTYAVGAQLVMTQVNTYVADPNLPTSLIHVVGVNDDVAQGDADAYTWLNAPGNDERSTALFGPDGYDPDEATLLTSFSSTKTDTAGVPRSTPETDTALADWLNTDTDGRVTLLLLRDKTNAHPDTYASMENASFDGPQLILTYATSAYCGQPGQSYAVGDLDNDCAVGLPDLALLATNWLRCTDPTDPQCP